MSKNYKYADVPWSTLMNDGFWELLEILGFVLFISLVLIGVISGIIIVKCVYVTLNMFQSMCHIIVIRLSLLHH